MKHVNGFWAATIVVGLLLAVSIMPKAPDVTTKGLTSITASVVTGQVFLDILGRCSKTFEQGWNFVSFCKNLSDARVGEVFSQINNSIKYVLEWDESLQEFKAFSFNQMNPSFTTFNQSKSYFILYNNATSRQLDMEGSNININITQRLRQGWNSVNYPYIQMATVRKYLSSLGSNFSFMMKWNQSSQSFIIFSPSAAEPQLTTIDTAEGQFILVTAANGSVLTYNVTDLG